MICRIARTYGGWPHEVARWPFTYYLRVRNELIESWKAEADAVKRATGDDGGGMTSIDMTPKTKRKRKKR